MALPLILIKKHKESERERERDRVGRRIDIMASPCGPFSGVDLIHFEVSYGHPAICLLGIHV